MVPFAVLSRTNLADASRYSKPNPRRFMRLRTLVRSCRSFSDSQPFFSISSALFDKNNLYTHREILSRAQNRKNVL